MRNALPGEVWMTDLGMTAKVRPCLVLTPPPADNELALVTVIPHTTSLREGNPWQVPVPKFWLKPGAFHLQQILAVPPVKFERLLGKLTDGEFALIKQKLALRLGLQVS
jgi:mRNA interferase MazF